MNMPSLFMVTLTLLLALARPCSSMIVHRRTSSTFGRTGIIARMSSSSSPPSSTNAPPKRIFCYGDSLTAGTSPPHDKEFPYGPHLEEELHRLASSTPSSSSVASVRWRGLPGWTAPAMVDHMDDPKVGLRSLAGRIRDPSLSLVIILAGTNDIGGLTSTMYGGGGGGGGEDADATSAVEPILRLHQACLDCACEDGTTGDICTLAVGIPGSAWQDMNPAAAKLCQEMNDALRRFANSEDGVSYVDFPFGFERGGGDGDSKYWSGDGLHFSPEGYEALGRGLAPCVKNILDEL